MKLSVSNPPHIKQGVTVKTIMWSKIAILVAVGLMAVFVFGLSALAMILVSTISAVLTERSIMDSGNWSILWCCPGKTCIWRSWIHII